MRNYSLKALLGFSLVFISFAHPALAFSSGDVAQVISQASVSAGGQSARNAPIAAFYRGRGNAPLWVTDNGLNPQAERALESVAGAEDDGLNGGDYYLNAINSLRNASSNSDRARLEVFVSHSIYRYINDLRYGRTTAERKETYETISSKQLPVSELARIAKSTPQNVGSLMANYAPPFPQYKALRKELQRYRAVAASGGMPQLNFYRLLQKNNIVPAVQTLRQILVSTGDLTRDNGTDVFDDDVDAAVRQFQLRHGIEPDGVVGRETRQELNTPAQTRISSLIASMERLRWLPDSFGKKYVIVNLPGYSLTAVRPGVEDLNMKIIVGKTARQSPTFIRSISQVIFNPPWTVPPRIAAEDILPDIKRYTEFFDRNDFKLLRYKQGGGTYEVNPKTINWDTVTTSNFQWTLYQPPGDRNPLGRVKFYIPDTPSVYMHDTPRKTLFTDSERNLSSGCIRLELPKIFATYVLADEKGWTAERVFKTFDTTKQTMHVPVRNQPRLYFVYWTATTDSKNLVHYHDDIYGRDRALLTSLGRI